MAIEHCICAVEGATIDIEKRAYVSGLGGKTVAWYKLSGRAPDLIKAGLLRAQDMPQGRKRVNYVLGDVLSSHSSIRKTSGEYVVVHHNEPAEGIAILCELALQGLVVPASILSVAWAPGAVEGPRRGTEISA